MHQTSAQRETYLHYFRLLLAEQVARGWAASRKLSAAPAMLHYATWLEQFAVTPAHYAAHLGPDIDASSLSADDIEKRLQGRIAASGKASYSASSSDTYGWLVDDALNPAYVILYNAAWTAPIRLIPAARLCELAAIGD